MEINRVIDKDKTNNLEEILRPCEMCVTNSGNLFFCFGDKNVKKLDFNQQVTNEKSRRTYSSYKAFL